MRADKQGNLFSKYLRLMPEPSFLLLPLLGHTNSCIYCVTKNQTPLIILQCTSGHMARICASNTSRACGLIAGCATAEYRLREAYGILEERMVGLMHG